MSKLLVYQIAFTLIFIALFAFASVGIWSANEGNSKVGIACIQQGMQWDGTHCNGASK